MASPLIEAFEDQNRWDSLIGAHYRIVTRTRDLNNTDRRLMSEWAAKGDAAAARFAAIAETEAVAS